MSKNLYKKIGKLKLYKKGIIFIIIGLIIITIYLMLQNNKGKFEKEATSVLGIYDNNHIYSNENSANNKNEYLNDWKLLLVNKKNYIDDNFTVDLVTLSSGHKIDKRAYDDLQNMMDDARKEGLKPLICSSYRTQDTQERLYNNEVKDYENKGYWINQAREAASMWVAIPGTSEHQTGLALDIVSLNYQLLNEKQEETNEQKWLINNSYKYGFILRYPTNKSSITGIDYEPWHYRYVGIEHAKIIKEKNFVLEEYIEYLKNN